MVFIGMLSFQLAGALILLLNCSIGSKKEVIRNCFSGTNIAKRDDDDNCIIPKKKLQESAHRIYINILAFFNLVVGYIVAAFSPVTAYSTCYTVLGVILTTIVLTCIEYHISKLVATRIYKDDAKVAYSELTGVDTFATEKEIEDKCNNIFDK